MSLLFNVCHLSPEFSNAYSADMYPELMLKTKRPYCCLFINLGIYQVCIPYRSNILHKYAYMFNKSARSANKKSGLDYSKVVIITKLEYLDVKQAVVDQDEYRETRDNIQKIVDGITLYIDEYVGHMKGKKILHCREFDRKYKYSTLKYFHSELGI